VLCEMVSYPGLLGTRDGFPARLARELFLREGHGQPGWRKEAPRGMCPACSRERGVFR
jgi:hypothetical protein